ncbi:hypothetical protein ACGFJC_49140 [Nonomuraea fuscirosea]|uniref:hypothetical protein n=1 Tax=Nonomuraea fuscirosea TaxID=1291556 RepID=UPI00371AA78E
MTDASPSRPALDVESIQKLARARGAVPDSGPYEPEPGGQPTVVSPEALPTDRKGLAQVVHALAVGGHTVWDPEEWPGLATALLTCGGGWPAVAELAELADPPDEGAIVAAVARLERQVAVGLGDEDRLPFWDVAAGLIARAWRFGVGGSVSDAVTLLGNRWTDLRAKPPRTPEGRYPSGVVACNCAWWFAELAAFQDTGPDMIVLLSETERLLPPHSITASFCAAAVHALRW